jgi:DNA-binding NarL/FixJ family response regulator
MSGIRTVILDGHYLVAQGVAELLNPTIDISLDILKIFTNAEEFKRFIRMEEVDLVIMEIALPDEDGLKLIPELRKADRELKILVLSSYSASKFVKKALQSGADGYLCKSNNANDLVEGIIEVVNNRTFVGEGLYITPPPNSKKVAKMMGTNGSYNDRFLIQKRLTKREQEILHLITEAKNNKEIATELFISDQTVGVHRKNIMRKLGVKNTVNLIKFAIEYQLV